MIILQKYNPFYILIVLIVVFIYFMIHRHYWLIRFLDSYCINSLIPILLLFSLLITGRFIKSDSKMVITRNIFTLISLICLYLVFATCSVLINEESYIDIRRYLIYIYSSIIIFIGIAFQYVYNRNEAIVFTLKALFWAGLFFSLYVVIIHLDPEYIRNLPHLITNHGIFRGDQGGGYGVGNFSIDFRYAIPGMSPIEYGPLLVPITLIGFYLSKRSTGITSLFFNCLIIFLVYCIAMTASRGSFLALIAAVMYIILWRWFSYFQIIMLVGLLIAFFATFAKVIFVRLIITLAYFLPINLEFISKKAYILAQDPRFIHFNDSISYIYHNFIWGLGMTAFHQELSYTKTHSYYLILPIAFGVPAAVFYFLFVSTLFLLMCKWIKRLPTEQQARDTGIILSSGLVANLVYMNGAPFDWPYIWVWFGLCGAWIIGCERRCLRDNVTRIKNNENYAD